MKAHPTSALAHTVGRGTSYTRALTPVPCDSFPGMVAQVTRGNPGTTCITYDDRYNHALLPAGASSFRVLQGCGAGHRGHLLRVTRR